MEKIQGKITKVIWAGDNHAVIVNIAPPGGKQFTAKGRIENAKKGVNVTMHGDWKFSDRVGKMQFEVKNAFVEVDVNEAAAVQFLASGAFKGIGEVLACAIVEKFGTNLPDYMFDIDKLMTMPRITEAKATAIAASYKENGKYFVCYQITGGDITLNQAKKIYDKYGSRTEETLKNNPYLLVYDIDTFGFHKADSIALKSGFAYDGRERICAGMVCALKNAAQDSGHCFLYEDELLQNAAELLLPITQMGTIFYQDVLKTSIPGNMADWRDTTLADLITNHPRVVENIVAKWDDKKTIADYEKKYSFSTDEMDVLYTYTTKRETFIDEMRAILEADSYDVSDIPQKELITTLYKKEARDKYLITDVNDYGTRRYYDRRSFLLEVKVAQQLISYMDKDLLIKIDDRLADDVMDSFEATTGNTLGREQRIAVKTTLTNRVSVITGGPGRGKTTIIKLIIDAWKSAGGNTLLLAPTGRAAQRMSEATGYPAMTIHRALLSLKTHRNAELLESLIKAESETLVIMDECSMMDMHLVNSTLDAFGECHLCFVGDADQLPCVGIGDFFDNIIKSSIVPCTRLIECYRNSGSISHNCDVILAGGKIKELINDHMFKTIPSKEPEVLQKNILNIYEKALASHDKKNISIIVPLRQNRKTSANELNKLIQEKFNPKTATKHEIKCGFNVFREGDRVMQTKNNYRLRGMKNKRLVDGVFNGETGEITEIDGEDVRILFDDGKEVIYSSIDLYEISLAYATTVHKAQGSEYPCVILGFTDGDYMLLCRKIIYTAASRGKQIVYLAGSPSAIQKAISNAVYEKRNTALSERMVKLSC